MNHVLRRIVLPFVVLSLMLVAAAPASADHTIGWCRTDPVVKIGGKVAHVNILSPEDAIHAAVTDATSVRIRVPRGVKTELLETDAGFGNLGYKVDFRHSNNLRVTDKGIPMVVEVKVPASRSLPVVVEVKDGADQFLAEETGETNRWLTVQTWL